MLDTDPTAVLIADRPVAIWLVRLQTGGRLLTPPFSGVRLLITLGRRLVGSGFRAVGIESLPSILERGIDVEPTSSVIMVDDFEKAWEYGEWPKVMMAFDWSRLDRSWREVPAETPPDELASLRERFPTLLKSTDGSKLWLSRLPEGDPRIAKGYEVSYGRWIPGDPFEALRALFLFSRPEDEELLRETARQNGLSVE